MRVLLSSLLFVLSAFTYAAENQATRFRGPNGQGIYLHENALTHWTDDDIKWQVDLPGQGHASPVKWDDTIFTVAADEKGVFYTVAIDAKTGRILWQQDFPFEKYNIHQESSYATSSPVVDAERVYVVYVDPNKTTVAAMTHSGDIAWTYNTDGVVTRHGYGMSPILVDDKVILTREQENAVDTPFKSTWLALDKKSGTKVWEIQRDTHRSNSFSTPSVMSLAGKDVIIFTSESGVTAVDPTTGKIVWEIDPFEERTITTPLIFDNTIVATCKGKLYAFATNGLNTPEIAYELASKYSPYCPTPIYVEGLLYNFMDNGYISCHAATTGDLIWREKPAGKFMGSPVWINGFVYAATTDAEAVVIRPGKTFELVAVNPLPEGTDATPIVSNGVLFFQTHSKLLAFGK